MQSVSTLVSEVKAGKYGDGDTRETVLAVDMMRYRKL